MKAISIRQPWAWAIAHAGKDIENRSWHMSHRGPLAIHAAKGMTRDEYYEFFDFFQYELGEVFIDGNVQRSLPKPEQFVRGAIIAVCNAIDCVHAHSSSVWYSGPHGLRIKDVIALQEPVPCRGALGFFDLPKDVDKAIAQMAIRI